MKTTLLTLSSTLIAITSSLTAQGIKPPAQIPTKERMSDEEVRKEVSYGIGFQNGERFAASGFIKSDLDKEAYILGFIAALEKKDFKMNPKKYDAAMQAFYSKLQVRETGIAKENAKKEQAFLAKNGKKKGVITTKSGLQYEIIKKGKGKSYIPPAGLLNGMDNVTEFHLNCVGTLLDGSEFLRTPKGQSVPFGLQVIHGFAEALKMMPIGSKWKIYVPSKLGFGGMRQSAKISPNSLLIYEIELKEITVRVPRAQPAPGQKNTPK